MKKNNLTSSLFAALLLAGPMANAASEYPAADFEPVVIYQDADYIAKHSQTPPPATLQAPTKVPAPVKAVAPESPARPAKVLGSPDELLMQDYLVGAVVLALAGLLFWSIKGSGRGL